MDISDEHLIWLGGLFSVGGYFGADVKRSRVYPYVALEGHPDLVAAVHLMAFAGRVARADGGRWRWRLTGDDAVELMQGLLPYIRGPKKDQLLRALEKHRNPKQEVTT